MTPDQLSVVLAGYVREHDNADERVVTHWVLVAETVGYDGAAQLVRLNSSMPEWTLTGMLSVALENVE